MAIPENLIPLVYLVTVAVIAVAFNLAGVPESVAGIIIGAGITRIKLSVESK